MIVGHNEVEQTVWFFYKLVDMKGKELHYFLISCPGFQISLVVLKVLGLVCQSVSSLVIFQFLFPLCE